MANRSQNPPPSHRKSESARRANQIIRGRTLLMMLLLGVGTFLLLFWKLYDLQINQYEEMQARYCLQRDHLRQEPQHSGQLHHSGDGVH